MATILEFRPAFREPVLASVEDIANARAAEVVLFPGVRHERVEDGEAPARPRAHAPCRSRRDHLEIED